MKTRLSQVPEDKPLSTLNMRISSEPNLFRRTLLRTHAVKHDLDKIMKSKIEDEEREDILMEKLIK